MLKFSYLSEKEGAGKSLYVCFMINLYFEKYDNVYCIANTHYFRNPIINPFFNENRFIYSPLSLFSRNLINDKNSLKVIVIDDNENMKSTSENWIKLIRNWSRKTNIILYFIGHYYTSVSRELRHALKYRVVPNFIKSRDCLEFLIVDTTNDEILHRNIISNISRFFSLYDTKEVVPIATDKLLSQELEKYAKTYDDLVYYISLLFPESKKVKKLKEYSKLLNLR